jgi:hypothetical protein
VQQQRRRQRERSQPADESRRRSASAIFFVTNDHSGDIHIEDSTITQNTGGSWYETYPQISNHADTPFNVVDSVIE